MFCILLRPAEEKGPARRLQAEAMVGRRLSDEVVPPVRRQRGPACAPQHQPAPSRADASPRPGEPGAFYSVRRNRCD
jgi:hypothetical protein